jgi:Raf kinase inhibitor-like YbhB/YbcL family protein
MGLFLVGCGSQKDSQRAPQMDALAKPMMLESPAFPVNGSIPTKYTCDGGNLSPPLRWDAPPAGTASFALVVEDLDAPGGRFLHWLVYNLPAELRQLPEALPPQPTVSGGGIQENNDFGKLGYSGPCPPGGTHRYVFRLYALDRSLNLPRGTTEEQLLAAMEGHILARAELSGQYSRKH